MAANLVVGAISSKAGFAMSGFTLLYIVIALWLFLYRRKRLMDGMKNKITLIGDESRSKLQDSMQKIVNDTNGGLICIII